MLANQKNDTTNVFNDTLVFPDQVDFYLQDNNDFNLVPENDEQVIVPHNLKKVIEKSDLFTKEDREKFIFE